MSEQVTKEESSEERTRPGRTYTPRVDITESESGLKLWADLPGVDEKSIEISLVDGVLSIEGHLDTGGFEGVTPAYTEYNVGNFARRFTLSDDIDSDAIEARCVNGVLELDLPKAARAQPRRIEVAAAPPS